MTAPGEDAGLFLTNLRVRGWMDYETLSRHREDLIMVSLSGDRHGRPQVDYTVNPALGIPDITGPEGHPDPVANALPAWDLIAGNLVVSSLLAAERHRLRRGVGQNVELSLKDVAAATLGHLGMIGDAVVNDAPRGKSGNALYGAYGQDFLCADDQRVMVIGLTDRQWRGLVEATGIEQEISGLEARSGRSLRDEGARWDLRHSITEILTPWFAARRLGDFASDFDRRGLTWSVFRTVKEAVAQDPDLSTDNPMFKMLHQPGWDSSRCPHCRPSFRKPCAARRSRPPYWGSIPRKSLQRWPGWMARRSPGCSIGGIVADHSSVQGRAA